MRTTLQETLAIRRSAVKAPQARTPVNPDKLHELILAEAIARVPHGGRRAVVRRLPDPIFNEFCRRLADRTATLKDTIQWLQGAVDNPPKRASCYRFAQFFLGVYRDILEERRVKS